MIDTENSGYDPDRTEAALMLMVRGLISAVGERALEAQLATSKGGGRKRRS
jgi:hypothetical protein